MKRNIWDFLVWALLALALSIIFLKLIGIINTPEIILYLPVIFKSGFNTSQLAATDLKRLKLSVAEGGNFAKFRQFFYLNSFCSRNCLPKINQFS